VKLQEDDPNAFKVLVGWLYPRTLPTCEELSARQVTISYNTVDKYDLGVLQDEMIYAYRDGFRIKRFELALANSAVTKSACIDSTVDQLRALRRRRSDSSTPSCELHHAGN
jgi:hypothetical protein